MEVVRIYNNNVVVTYNVDGEEAIAIGKGLAFQKRPGDTLEEDKIEKIFLLKDKTIMSKLEKLVQDIPSVYLTISEEIVQMIHNLSDIKVNENIYITLTDHISASLEREKNNIICENPLLMEIKQFYKEEFKLAKMSAEIIKKHVNIQISEEEMGFITLHIVNASMNQRADNTLKGIKLVRDIIQIVEKFFEVPIDKESLRYDRFIRHLQFLARRLLEEDTGKSEDDFLYTLGRTSYPNAFACAEEISTYIGKTYKKTITNAEKGYLVYHIINVLNER